MKWLGLAVVVVALAGLALAVRRAQRAGAQATLDTSLPLSTPEPTMHYVPPTNQPRAVDADTARRSNVVAAAMRFQDAARDYAAFARTDDARRIAATAATFVTAAASESFTMLRARYLLMRAPSGAGEARAAFAAIGSALNSPDMFPID